MMKRQPNGTWRGAGHPIVVSESVLRARWVEAETIHLKRMGLSFDAISEEMRKLDNSRSEELYMNLQPSIRKGNPRAVEVGIKVLDHAARINGYAAPQRHELTGKDGKPLTLVQLLQAIGPIGEEDEK